MAGAAEMANAGEVGLEGGLTLMDGGDTLNRGDSTPPIEIVGTPGGFGASGSQAIAILGTGCADGSLLIEMLGTLGVTGAPSRLIVGSGDFARLVDSALIGGEMSRGVIGENGDDAVDGGDRGEPGTMPPTETPASRAARLAVSSSGTGDGPRRGSRRISIAGRFPRSKLLLGATPTGGRGKARRLGPKPTRSRDLTDDTVSERSTITEIAAERGPAMFDPVSGSGRCDGPAGAGDADRGGLCTGSAMFGGIPGLSGDVGTTMAGIPGPGDGAGRM